MDQSLLIAFAPLHRRAYAAFNEGDWDSAFSNLAPEVEWHTLSAIPEAGVLQGRDEVIRFYERLVDDFHWQVEPQEYIDAGEGRVVVRTRGTAVGKRTEITTTREFFQVFELTDEMLVKRIRDYEDRSEALEAVGLRE